jgi:hypothetical protein
MRTRNLDEAIDAVSKVYCPHAIEIVGPARNINAVLEVAHPTSQPLVALSYSTAVKIDAGNFPRLFPGCCECLSWRSYQAPRSWAERAYRKLIYYNQPDRGGHSPPGNSRNSFPKRFARAFDRFGNRSEDPDARVGRTVLRPENASISEISHGRDRYARSHRP